MLNSNLLAKFWPIFNCAIFLLACKTVQCTRQNKLYMQLTLKQYTASASDNDFYKCGHTAVVGGDDDLCTYELHIETYSDGITRGKKLFAKAKYSVEIIYPLLEHQNTATFQLSEYPQHNMSVRVTLYYYSAKGDRIARTFHGVTGRLPQVSTEIMQDNEQMTMLGDSHSSFSLDLKLFCNTNYYGSLCAKHCIAGSGEYCNQDGDLLPRRTASITATGTISKSIPTTVATTAVKYPWLLLIACAGLVALLVALTACLVVCCFCRCGRRRDNPDTTPKSQQSHGQGNFVDVAFLQPQPYFTHSPSVRYNPYVAEPQMAIHDGTYPRQTMRPNAANNLIVMPPPPPAPAPLGPDCYFPDGQPHQRSSCSGSSRTFADACDPPRQADGVNDVLGQGQPSSMTVNFDTMRLPTYQPPADFGTGTMRSGDSGGRSFGSRHNVTIRSFQC